MISSLSLWAFLLVNGGPFLLGLVSIAFSFYMSRRHVDDMLEALKNSRHIVIWGAGLRHQGWFGRLMLVAKIGGMVMWSGPGIRAGEMDPVDIKNFPPHLKRLLKAKMVLTGVIVVWLAIVVVLVKLE
jgi:hypothetical protein